MKRTSSLKGSMDNAELYRLLRRWDPVEPPSELSMRTLESSIFAQIDRQTRPAVPADMRMPLWIFHQGWGARAAAFAAAFIIMVGFIAGQIAYKEANLASFSSTPSLLAFADEASAQTLPTTDTSWGDTDDATE